VAYFLGIDGGGSKTSCVIGDETTLLGRGEAAASNIVRIGETQARESLAAAIKQACEAAQVNPQQVSRTCAGVAGGGQPRVSEAVRRIVCELVAGEVQIVGDMVIALEAAFGEGPGVIVIAGTGSIAYGRNPAGETARAGGWGSGISDEGSGHFIGRTAVASALRAHDEGRPGTLLENIMRAWKAATLDQFIMAVNAPPQNFASLFPIVMSAADAGDSIAHTVLWQAGEELAELASVVIRRLFPQSEAVTVATCGGVFRNSGQVRQVFYNKLGAKCPMCVISKMVFDPVDGALARARRS